jgi:F-type H+-transporting ATPase subunit epsilon
MSTFLLEIVTPERKVYEQEVNMVIVKGTEGEMGILKHHIPLVTALKIAPVVAKKESGDDVLAVNAGFIEVGKEKVVILAESAESAAAIDVDRAKAAADRARQRLADKKQENIDYLRAEIALQKALNRIEVAGRK